MNKQRAFSYYASQLEVAFRNPCVLKARADHHHLPECTHLADGRSC